MKKMDNMGQKLKSFVDGSFLEYDSGNFDNWCVYLTRPTAPHKAPRDVDYFYELKQYAQKYGVQKVYGDFVKIYNFTGKNIEMYELSMITKIAASYNKDAVEMDIIFSVLYMAMIAEEQRKYTRLGKRIKRLGIHMLLLENCSVIFCPFFTRQKMDGN